jgi:hypothetical protein
MGFFYANWDVLCFRIMLCCLSDLLCFVSPEFDV